MAIGKKARDQLLVTPLGALTLRQLLDLGLLWENNKHLPALSWNASASPATTREQRKKPGKKVAKKTAKKAAKKKAKKA